MKAKEEKKLYEKFDQEIRDRGLKRSWVARQLEISDGHLSNMLKGKSELIESHRKQLNKVLNTNY